MTDADAFRLAVRGGRRAATRTVVVHVSPDLGGDPAAVQVGFVVSKAVGNAVVRNRVKRRLRHLMREHLPGLQALPGRRAVVVRALPAAATATSSRLGADLDQCLQRVAS